MDVPRLINAPELNGQTLGTCYRKKFVEQVGELNMKKSNHRICPVERAGHLETRLRRWVQNPEKILSPYVKKGMTVLDMGAGPGFFSIPLARMVGETGHVVACDLQQGMLDRIAVQ